MRLFQTVLRSVFVLGVMPTAANADDTPPPVIEVTIGDQGCEPTRLDVPPVKVRFKIENASERTADWAILRGNLIIGERVNILAGGLSTLTTTLAPNTYEMTCGLASNPRGKLIVKTVTPPDATRKAADLGSVIIAYRGYVAAQVADLVIRTSLLVKAVKTGRLEAARKAYAPAHIYYESIAPVAKAFGDLDKRMDARADADATREAAAFSGYHRIEYGLFARTSTDGLAPYADQLMADALDLQDRVATLHISPNMLIGGAVELIEKIAPHKLSGRDNRYSKTDLWDVQANLDGVRKIIALLRPQLLRRDPELLARIEADATKIDQLLSKYRLADGGFESDDALTLDDRNALKEPLIPLADDLLKLRGALGLD